MNERFFTVHICDGENPGRVIIKQTAGPLHRVGLFLLVCILAVLSPSAVVFPQDFETRSKDPRFELKEVVVTATKLETSVRDVPRNVTVITRDDIEQASSNQLADLLAREAGVMLRSFYGHDKKAGVDIRGMGDTFAGNTIVMVDGVKLNPPDLSGPDLSVISLDQVERIEIIRGSGAVVHGDGAVAGVVNIITKEGDHSPRGQVFASYGSYDASDSRVSYGGKVDRYGFNIHADYFDSDGYRSNGYMRKKGIAGKARLDVVESAELALSAAHHEDQYGLPGSVAREAVDSRSRRRETDNPNDYGETTDTRYIATMTARLGRWGDLSVLRGYRFRDNEYVINYTPRLSKAAQLNAIDEDSSDLDVTFETDFLLLGREATLRAGGDHFETEYISTRLYDDTRNNIEAEDYGVFATNEWHLSDALSVHVGYRYNKYEGRFREDERRDFSGEKRWVNGTESKNEWTHHPYDIGVVYSPQPRVDLFSSYATSFRVPNGDELARSDGDLRPQEGNHVELGTRYHTKDMGEFAVTLFRMEIDDEIYYGEDPVTSLPANRNFEDTTVRQGVEADLKVFPTPSLLLWANYAYTEAEFENRNTTVPLVPEHQVTGGLEWWIRKPLCLFLTGTWVNSRFDGNDRDNDRFAKLDSYLVFDCKLTYERDGLTLFAGVNNVFDELYSTVAYSETYYPMPERNFYGGVEWTF